MRAKSDRNQQQGLEVLLDGKPDEEGAYCYHNEVAYSGVSKRRVGEELIEVLNDKLS